MNGQLLILGPQRPEPNLPTALADAGCAGPIALVTAGWRHDEADLSALREHLSHELVPLSLYRWFEQIMVETPDLHSAYRARQDRIQRNRARYRIRLGAAFSALLKLRTLSDATDQLQADELQDALRELRALDDRVLQVCDRIRAESGHAEKPWLHPAVSPFHRHIRQRLEGCDTLVIAGGHVAILLYRLHFFGFGDLLRAFMARGGRIVAWSAGAMVLGERVVLYYDDPPEGPSEPEVLDRGFGLVASRTLFPHARQRLRLDSPERLHLLQDRFGTCLGLENGAAIHIRDGEWGDRSAPGSLLTLTS